MARSMFSKPSVSASRSYAMCLQTADMPEINCVVRSKGTETGPSKSSSGQIVPKALKSCPEDGSSSVPLPGSIDVGVSQDITTIDNILNQALRPAPNSR